jgi:transcriptional regulator with XRE-family HTH domain
VIDFVGERIRKARESNGISQKKLGMALGLSDKAISAYEAGRTYPPIDTLFRISVELKKPLVYFLSEDDQAIDLFDKVEKIEQSLKSATQDIAQIKKALKKN